MTTETPEDIRAKAKAVRALGCADPCAFDAGCGCLDAIAQALMQERQAERERCAKIAEGYQSYPIVRRVRNSRGNWVDEPTQELGGHGPTVAAYIRSQPDTQEGT